MTGEVEAAKLDQAEQVVRTTYDAFRGAGPSGALDDRKALFAESFADLPDYVVDVGRAEIQSALDGLDVGSSLRLNDMLDAVTEGSVQARLQEDYPASDDLIVIAVSADADALPGACIISHPRDALDCP